MSNSKPVIEQKPLFEEMTNPTAGEGESTAIIEIDDEETAAPMVAYSDKPIFRPEDITPPVLKLLQGLSPEVQEGNGRPGQWSLGGHDPEAVLTVVPLSYARRREYRDADSNFISCSSYDGETGTGEPGGLCADCAMNKWSGEGKNRKGPQCVFMYSYMVYIKEYDTAAIMNFKRTGLAIGKSLNSIMSRQGFGRVAITISSKLQTGGKGTYYIPQLLPVPNAAAAEVIESAKNFFGG